MSKIEWTNRTWNPLAGCTKISDGCKNCYAIKDAHRLASNPNPKISKKYEGTTDGPHRWTGRINLDYETLLKPLHWSKPSMVFVNSMSDLFHHSVPDDFIDAVFAVMALTPQHTYQILTKRPDRMREYLKAAVSGQQRIGAAAISLGLPVSDARKVSDIVCYDPLPNVWLGTSVENQETANERIPHLLDTPAAVRWLSMEPLLGDVSLKTIGYKQTKSSADPQTLILDALSGHRATSPYSSVDGPGIDWVVVGGESGPGARPMHPDWARSIRDQCKCAGVPFFFKQWGEYLPFEQYGNAGIEDDIENSARFRVMEWRGEPLGWDDVGYPCWGDFYDGHIDEMQCVGRVGKKAAGRLLDGVEHNEWPTVQR